MALVVFLRGINVGGHRRFRPRVLAKELRAFDVVSIGATGTFIVRRRCSRATLRAAIARNLPFEAEMVFCEGRELLDLKPRASRGDIVPFVTILPRTLARRFPVAIPRNGKWFVRVVSAKGRFVFGEYRRDMKTIRHLTELDNLFGMRAPIRTWGTMMAIVERLDPASKRNRAR